MQEKSKLEAQIKQYESQKQLMTKTLEKQGAIESKKRESIMVVSGSHVSCLLVPVAWDLLLQPRLQRLS